MAKDPAFLFYYQDFLVGTDEFTNEQVGAYIRCLCIQAAKGGISENHMIKICESQSIHEIIIKKFVWFPEEGVFRNDRLSEEIEKRKKYCESRGNNKKGKKHVKIISKSYDSHMEDENENICIRIIGVLENNKVLNGESENEKKILGMLIIEMEKIWLKYRPDYTSYQMVDYPAMLSIAYHIAGKKGWTKHSVTSYHERDIVDSWEKITIFLNSNNADNFLKKQTLDGVANPKIMQRIEEGMKQIQVNKQPKMIL